MTTRQILEKARADYEQGEASYARAIANIVGAPFKAGDVKQHGRYIKACEAVEQASCPRKKDERWAKWMLRLPDVSDRAAWRDAFNTAIKNEEG